MVRPLSSFVKYFYVANFRPSFFDTKRYVSYFT